MITAEELEDCDICPKKITFGSAIKFCLYFLFMLFSALLMLSFYSGRDFSSIISFDTLKFGSESIFMKKLMNTVSIILFTNYLHLILIGFKI